MTFKAWFFDIFKVNLNNINFVCTCVVWHKLITTASSGICAINAAYTFFIALVMRPSVSLGVIVRGSLIFSIMQLWIIRLFVSFSEYGDPSIYLDPLMLLRDVRVMSCENPLRLPYFYPSSLPGNVTLHNYL